MHGVTPMTGVSQDIASQEVSADVKLLRGYDSWLEEPPIRRQVSGALGEQTKEVLQRSAESLASVPLHQAMSPAVSCGARGPAAQYRLSAGLKPCRDPGSYLVAV